MQTASSCSTMGCQSVEGVQEMDQGSGPSMVVTVHHESKSQLLPSMPRTATVDDTIGNEWLRMKAQLGTRAHAAQNSGTDHGRAAWLACTHVLHTPEAQERQQDRVILSRAAQRTEGAQLGRALVADHVLGFQKFQ